MKRIIIHCTLSLITICVLNISAKAQYNETDTLWSAYNGPYDSIIVIEDTLSLIRRTDYYVIIQGVPIVVKRYECRQKCLNCERSDCFIYILKDDELIFYDFLQGAE
ncbi:MAG: hypothetical protein H7X71_04970 [Chitinophagales bacterium]|nr:hypothetical protein [Chitinophagales bacterium]